MIKNNFCGRVKIGGAEFVCSVTGHIVTVLPACQEDIKKLIPAYAVSNPEYIVGVDENSHLIALLVQKDIAATPFAMMSSRFFATIMLQSTSNTNFKGPIDKFDAISFTDGTINTVYNPKIAALERVTEDSVLAHIQDRLPEIAKAAGVGPIVSKWDMDALARYKSAELVDVTMPLVNAFPPNERQLKFAIDIQQQAPIPLADAGKTAD